MDNSIRGDGSLSSFSSDQAFNCKGWERFLPKRPLRVLVVEDDSSTRQVVWALLSKCGYEVSCAKDGSEAWDLLEQSKQVFDLVLADAMMPGLSGTDLLVKIMSSEAHREIPVIMMSAHDSLDMVFKCLLKGAKDFLVKPLRKNELRNLWQHVWRRNHASGGSGSQGNGHGKKRKASRNLSSGDVSNDNFSVSNGVDDQIAHGDERNAQCDGVCQPADHNCQPSFQNLDCNQVAAGKYNDACTAAATSELNERIPPSERKAESPTSLEASEASGTSAKAFDFFGTKATEPASEHLSSIVNLSKKTMASSQNCQASPALELTLKRTSSTGDAGRDPFVKQGVRQSDCSAFSKYTSNTSLTQQSCIVRSTSLPSDEGTHGCVLNGGAPHSIDGPRTPMDICGRINDRTPVPENCNSGTLHFPKASHFQHGRQLGNPPFSQISSCCDENCRKAQDTFRSPSLNSSTANSLIPVPKDAAILDSDQLSRLNLNKDGHVSGSLAGSTWCSAGSDREVLSSNNAKLGQLFSCTNGNCVRTNTDNYGFYEHPDKPSNVDGFANVKAAPELPTYTMVSGRGSNDCSDRGSNLLEEHLAAGRSDHFVAAQDGHSLSGWHANENSRMDMDGCGMHESNTSDQRPLVYDYRSSFREAALHKFRQKRKMRCFEKKVRYQSRKKLAEQRPRVKGQFVRRAVHDPAAEMNATS